MDSYISTKNQSIFYEENIKSFILPQFSIYSSKVSMIKFKNTDKQRAVFKIDTDAKSYCLKKVYFPIEELLYVYSATEWLYRFGLNIPNLLSSSDGKKFVYHEDMLFILTPWIEGNKCNFDILEHNILAIEELASLHKVSKAFTPIKGSINRHSISNINESILKHLQQLVSTLITAEKTKDKFSKIFIKSFEDNLTLCQYSINTSSKIDYSQLSLSLCHGDYVNKNIIIDNNKNIWIIDFDKCKYDYCAHDIAYYLRRLLKREKTNWNFNLALELLNKYNNKKALTSSDLKYIISYLCFPQKYWKISKDYYKNIKKCNKNSFISLLKKSTSNTKNHINFCKDITDYFDNTNWMLKKR